MSTKKTSEAFFAETKFNLKLGDKIYTLNFGTKTFMRISEAKPEIKDPTQLLVEMNPIFAIPLLVECAIKPEDREWTSYDDFLDLYDDCADKALEKVLPAYISAISGIEKKLTPVVEAMNARQKEGK